MSIVHSHSGSATNIANDLLVFHQIAAGYRGSNFSIVWLWVSAFCFFAGAAAVMMQVQVLALDRRFGFAGAGSGSAFWFSRCCCRAGSGWAFWFAGAAAALTLALDWRFVLLVLVPCWCRRWLWIGVWFCVVPGMTSHHAKDDIVSRQG